MKIMFYNDDISVSSGGTERVITNLARQFSEAGYDCVMLNHVKGETEYLLNEKIHRLIMRPQGPRKGVLKKYDIVRGIRCAVKKESPDVLITFGVGMINRAMFATIGLPVKNIISYRCAPEWDFRNFTNKFLMKTLHRRADAVVFLSMDTREVLPKSLAAKGRQIYSHIDTSFFNTVYNGPRKDIVSVGRLKEMKNFEMLINAFAAIADKIDDDLLIYGEGLLKESLQRQIDELGLSHRVFLKGLCANVANTIKSAKLFVVSSNHEGGGPNTLMEAMALGIPCIATDCRGGGPRMLFDDDLKQYLVQINDTKAMSDKIMEVIGDPQKLAWMGEKAKLHALRFNPESIMRQWENLIQEVVNK